MREAATGLFAFVALIGRAAKFQNTQIGRAGATTAMRLAYSR
jgi:hypothetical protein